MADAAAGPEVTSRVWQEASWSNGSAIQGSILLIPVVAGAEYSIHPTQKGQ